MAVSQTRSLSQLLTSRHRSRSRARAIALVACVGMTGSAAVAQETTYRWWNPNGAPETGSMNDSANWEDFVKPSLHPDAMNRLVFEFVVDGDFEAFNNLRDFLSVSSMSRGRHEGTARITGLPLKLRPAPGAGKCLISGGQREPLVLETPLGGTSGFEVDWGTVELRPANRQQHTITGGIEISGHGELAVSEAWHLGALSNTVHVMMDPFGQGGTLRFDAPMTIAIPVACLGGSINTAASGRVTISELGTSTRAEKIGSGTLRIASGSLCNWVVRDGVLEIDPEALSRVEIRDRGVLRLVDDSLIRRLSAMDGTVDLDGHTLVLEEGLVYGRIVGDGTVRFVGDEPLAIKGQLPEFVGTLEADGGVILVDLNLESPMTISVPNPSDQIHLQYRVPFFPHRIGSLAGTGAIYSDAGIELHVGMGDQGGSFPGSLRGVQEFVKVGHGTHALTGVNDLTGGSILVTQGTLSLSDSAVGGAASITVEADGTFSPFGAVNAPTIEGAGTVALGSQTFTVGEPGGDFTFSGTLEGNPETSTFRKRGGGTLTLSGDTAGFGGFFDIIDGAVRFAGGPILPAAAGLTITGGELRGYGEYSGAYWNQSVIAADSSSGVLRLSGEDQWNNGTIRAEGDGAIELAGVFLEQDFSGGGQQGRLIADGAPVRMLGDEPVVVQGGDMETVGDGAIEMRGSAITLRDVDHAGHMSLGLGVDITAEDVGLVTEADHTLHVEFEPDADSEDGAIRGRGTGVLGGTLRVTLPDGYSPAFGDRMTVIGGDDTGEWTIDESFDTIILPDISPWQMRVVSRPDTLQLVVTRKADVAAPFGKVDVEDIRRFFGGFGGGRPVADIAEPFGRVTIEDAIAFIEDFNGAKAVGR
ncbi:MAG: hypothetical protein ACF8R9_09970 [Phycisphaerales bacterium JB054]